MSMNQVERIEGLVNAFETGEDYRVEFNTPEPSAPHCFFSLDGDSDLTVVYEDYIAGEKCYEINLDEAVRRLLDTFAEESQVTLRENPEDVSTLKTLALRFQFLAARLLREARQREAKQQASRWLK